MSHYFVVEKARVIDQKLRETFQANIARGNISNDTLPSERAFFL